MRISRATNEIDTCLAVASSLTDEHSRDIENLALEIIRYPAGLKVDQSGVDEVDLRGNHLVSVLQQCDLGNSLKPLATSPSIDQALTRPLSHSRTQPPCEAGRQGQAQPLRSSMALETQKSLPDSHYGNPLPRSIGIWALFSVRGASEAPM